MQQGHLLLEEAEISLNLVSGFAPKTQIRYFPVSSHIL